MVRGGCAAGTEVCCGGVEGGCGRSRRAGGGDDFRRFGRRQANASGSCVYSCRPSEWCCASIDDVRGGCVVRIKSERQHIVPSPCSDWLRVYRYCHRVPKLPH
jgi:hypothetical protein